jgi:hypothetical protein
MPIIDVDNNIRSLRDNIERLTQEIYRLEGMLNTFQGFKRGGLKVIDLPNDPHESKEMLDSIQEKPE